MSDPVPTPAAGEAKATLFRVAVVEGSGPEARELGYAFLGGTREPDPAHPGEFKANVNGLPPGLLAQANPDVYPDRRIECTVVPVTPEECVVDGFLRALGGAPNPAVGPRCWKCFGAARWTALVKFVGTADALLGYAYLWHCDAHRPSEQRQGAFALDSVPVTIFRGRASEAWRAAHPEAEEP